MNEPGEKEDNWDPPEDRREWWRNIRDGQRGYKVRRNGVWRIRLDRPEQDINLPMTGYAWTVDHDLRPLNKHDVATVAFAADKRLCFVLGDHESSRREWHELTEQERIRFMQKGPEDTRIRNNVWRAIMRETEPLTK